MTTNRTTDPKETTMARTPEDTCRRLVDLLTQRTGIDWTFGYIGDVSGLPGTPAFRDSRSWYAFAGHPGRVGDHRDRIGGTTDPADLVPMLQGALALATVQATTAR